MHTLRPLTPEDASEFAALRLRGLKECPSAFASSHEEEVGTPLPELAARLAPQPDRAVLGAFDEGRLVAVVGIQREGMVKLSHKAFVWGVYVAPEARGRGVGMQVLDAALAHAASVLGVRQVNLGVNTSNLAAIALYRKLGFQAYGLERDYLLVDGVFHDEHQMVCRLSAGSGVK